MEYEGYVPDRNEVLLDVESAEEILIIWPQRETCLFLASSAPFWDNNLSNIATKFN